MRRPIKDDDMTRCYFLQIPLYSTGEQDSRKFDREGKNGREVTPQNEPSFRFILDSLRKFVQVDE